MGAQIGHSQCLPSKISNPRARGSCDHGGSRNPAITGCWDPEIAGRWGPGILGFWDPGIMGRWGPGILGTRGQGAQRSWNPGALGSQGGIISKRLVLALFGHFRCPGGHYAGPNRPFPSAWRRRNLDTACVSAAIIRGQIDHFQPLGAGAIWTLPAPRGSLQKRFAQAMSKRNGAVHTTHKHVKCDRAGPRRAFKVGPRRAYKSL